MRLTRNQAEVKIDWDSPVEPDIAEMERLLARAGYTVDDTAMRKSPGGNGWHIILELKPRPTSAYEVVALQLLLGSDKNREAVQMHRAKAFRHVPRWMRDMWNVLYLPHPQRERHRQLTPRLEIMK
jgi:hypothetical protein